VGQVGELYRLGNFYDYDGSIFFGDSQLSVRNDLAELCMLPGSVQS